MKTGDAGGKGVTDGGTVVVCVAVGVLKDSTGTVTRCACIGTRDAKA